MNGASHHGDSWSDPLRRAGESLLQLIRTRLELFGVELQEEKLRLIGLLLWLGLAIILAGIGLLVAVGALSLWLWHVAGYAGLIALALTGLGASAAIVLHLRSRIRNGPAPFTGVVSEFEKDCACFRNG